MSFQKHFNISRYSIRNKKRVLKSSYGLLISFLRILVLLAIGYIVLYPLLFMVVTSLKSRTEFYVAGRVWLPMYMDPKYNYLTAIKHFNYFGALRSTIFYEIVAALLEVASCAVAAYGFARFNFKLKGIMMTGMFLTILIPENMIIIPKVVNYSNLDFLGIIGLINKISGANIRISLIDTPYAFYLPSVFAVGLRAGILIYIYIQFFKGLPKELEEAAWVDGAGPIRTFLSIALPSSSVVFTTATVFSVVWHWNDTLLASTYLKTDFPLSVMLSRIINSMTASAIIQLPETPAILMAACVLFVAPVLIFYMILQRKFIESIDRVGITG